MNPFKSPDLSPLQIQQEKLDYVAKDLSALKEAVALKSQSTPSLEERLIALETAQIHPRDPVHKMQTVSARPESDRMSPSSSPDARQMQDFMAYVRKGHDFVLKSMNGSEDSEGGYLVPQQITHTIQSRLQEASFFRQIARVTSISTDALELLMDQGEAAVGWAQEKDAREETALPELAKIHIPVHELYARPRATQRLLDDAFVNLEQWIAEKITEQMGTKETMAFISGDGEGKPKGFLAYPNTEDPKEWGKIQTLKTGVPGGFPEDSPENCLIDLFHALKPAYLKDAVWLMSRTTQAFVRKLKDPSDTAFLWQPSLSASQLPTLMGYPVYITDHMPSPKEGESTPSIAFGNFKEAYQIVDRQGMHILRDPYSAKPYVEFYTTKRVGGDVVNFEAIKILAFGR